MKIMAVAPTRHLIRTARILLTKHKYRAVQLSWAKESATGLWTLAGAPRSRAKAFATCVLNRSIIVLETLRFMLYPEVISEKLMRNNNGPGNALS
jgi:hypothetical protein